MKYGKICNRVLAEYKLQGAVKIVYTIVFIKSWCVSAPLVWSGWFRSLVTFWQTSWDTNKCLTISIFTKVQREWKKGRETQASGDLVTEDKPDWQLLCPFVDTGDGHTVTINMKQTLIMFLFTWWWHPGSRRTPQEDSAAFVSGCQRKLFHQR